MTTLPAGGAGSTEPALLVAPPGLEEAPERRPFLKSFLFCQSTGSGAGGMMDLRGIWQQLRFEGRPGRYQVGIFVCWADLTRPLHEMEIAVQVPEAPAPFVVSVPVETSGRPEYDWMNMVVLELVIVREGEIRFHVALDGVSHGSCSLPVLPVGEVGA